MSIRKCRCCGGVTLLVGNLLPDIDNDRADPTFGFIRMILFSAGIAGAPLILMQYLWCKRTGSLCAGELVWCNQGFWGVFLIFLSYSNISGFGPFMLFLGTQIITFLLSCGLLLAMIVEQKVDVHRISWTGWVGTLRSFVAISCFPD